MEQTQFDTIYHEHFSYLSFLAVREIFEHHGLTLFDVEELRTHGGSLRIYARNAEAENRPVEGRVKEFLPDAHADFIFAVAGEEFGLIPCLILVALFTFVVLRGFSRVVKSGDLFILLAVSGLLDLEMGGSMLHVGNREFFFDHTSIDKTKYDSTRRSLYLPVVRNHLYDLFSLFDYSDASMMVGSRSTSTIAPQALFMMNSDRGAGEDSMVRTRITTTQWTLVPSNSGRSSSTALQTRWMQPHSATGWSTSISAWWGTRRVKIFSRTITVCHFSVCGLVEFCILASAAA